MSWCAAYGLPLCDIYYKHDQGIYGCTIWYKLAAKQCYQYNRIHCFVHLSGQVHGQTIAAFVSASHLLLTWLNPWPLFPRGFVGSNPIMMTYQIVTFSALLAICAGNSPVSSEFPVQRPVTQSFDVFFDLRLNKRFSKESWGWLFETLSCPSWRPCNVLIKTLGVITCTMIIISSHNFAHAIAAQLSRYVHEFTELCAQKTVGKWTYWPHTVKSQMCKKS